MMHKVLQALSIVLALIGTYLLAFGLKVRTGISDELRKELEIEKKELIAPADVRQRTSVVSWGLVMISLAALLQLWVIFGS